MGQMLLPITPLLTPPLSFPGGDHRYMNNYTNSYASEWNAPDTMKRYSMYLTPKGKGKLLCGVIQPAPPSRVTVFGLPGIALARTCCPVIIINRASSHCQKHPGLDDKLSGALLLRGFLPL